MTRAQARYLPDGRRLHLQHGPIDMIVDADGPGRAAALARAAARFDSLLDELVAELPALRRARQGALDGDTARRMQAAVTPFGPAFITPMAAVAGAGADTILRAMRDGPGLRRAYVNNGGDIAFHLARGESFTAAVAGMPGARIMLGHGDPVRGMASSGWRGRSHSLGIADSVSVLAGNAAAADAAATMIANAVDLPEHKAIQRVPATQIAPDSDLGSHKVTMAVGPLTGAEIDRALQNGTRHAETCRARGLIYAAILVLHGQYRLVGPLPLIQQKDLAKV